MKFIEFTHPEGGRLMVHVDHIMSAHFRPGDAEVKPRVGLALAQRQHEIVLFGLEAEQIWQTLKTFAVPS